MKKLLFVKSAKAEINFPVNWGPENSFYDQEQVLIKGFIRTEKGKICTPAVAEVYFFDDTYFVRSIQCEAFDLSFSAAGNVWQNDCYMGNLEVDFLSF